MGRTTRFAATLLTAGVATVALGGVANAASAAPAAPAVPPNPAQVVYEGVIGGTSFILGAGYSLATPALGALVSLVKVIPGPLPGS